MHKCCNTHECALELPLFGGCHVKLGESEHIADGVADVGVEEECHAAGAKVTVSVASPVLSVHLGVRPQITHTLDVYHNQLMSRTLKREVAKGLQ